MKHSYYKNQGKYDQKLKPSICSRGQILKGKEWPKIHQAATNKKKAEFAILALDKIEFKEKSVIMLSYKIHNENVCFIHLYTPNNIASK